MGSEIVGGRVFGEGGYILIWEVNKRESIRGSE